MTEKSKKAWLAAAGLAAGVISAAWGYMGYKGWTWIPLGRPPRKGQIRVACAGDSITYGMLIKNWYRYNYPEILQKKLGKDYCVHNYGLSMRTGMKTGDYPYSKEYRYKRSLAFAPDIVLLMFGTNDSKTGNWQGKEEFIKQYRELIDSYRNLESHPEVILLQPPCPHHKDGSEGDIYTFDIQRSKIEEICEAVRELAAENGNEAPDLFTLTEDHPEWFAPDGIHPNAAGAEQIADLLALLLKK